MPMNERSKVRTEAWFLVAGNCTRIVEGWGMCKPWVALQIVMQIWHRYQFWLLFSEQGMKPWWPVWEDARVVASKVDYDGVEVGQWNP